jgi:hypothetical protein
MSGLFQQINGNITQEQVMEIAKTGVVPSHLKSVDDKVYYIIMRNYMITMYSNIAGVMDEYPMEIDGEAFIVAGRHNAFNIIKEYLTRDGENGTDLRKSIVMVEGVDAAKGVSLYRFIKLCNQAYPDEAIDEEFLEESIQGFTDWKENNNAPSYDIVKAVEESQKPATGFGGNAGTLMNEEEE